MMPSPRPAFRPSPRAFAAAAAQVTVSPSRTEVRRADPSLSFRVVAPGARGFDVIVTTEPALFDPANAHRRTPKNFRSSRQDFGGEVIEIETGFYLLPRAFLRDLMSLDPKPTRLYYIAVAYDDPAARQGRYSVMPEAMASQAPFVGLAADLAAANLSRMLGVAVDRLGAVNARGRVMAVAASASATPLPDAIGGLPLDRQARRVPDALPGDRAAPGFRTAPAGGGARYAPRFVGAPPAPGANGSGPAPAATGGGGSPLPVADNGGTPAPAVAAGARGFFDEDYAYGGRGGGPAGSAYRDLDNAHATSPALYDDGFGDATPPPQTPIPPLDPAPEAPSARPSQPANGAGSMPANGGAAVAPAGGAAEEELLVEVILAEGVVGRYEALSLDGGFRGRFGPADPYYQRAHDGLRLGPHQATQDTGELGELLALMRDADPAGFAQIFGPEAPALLEITTAEGPSSLEMPDGRGPRVQPVAGRDLWEEPWVERFRAAARHLPFQAAMRAQILARRLDPMRPAIEAPGLGSARGTALVLAAAILRGPEAATALVRQAVNPFDTPARLGAALDALGASDLGTFRAACGLPPGDTVDDATHFALIAALRELGPDSPVQVPDAEAIMDALVTTAGPGPLGDALLKLRVSAALAPAGA